MLDPFHQTQDVVRIVLALSDPGNYAFSFLCLPYFATALTIAATGALAYYWERGSRLGWLFAGFSMLTAAAVFLRGLMLLVDGPDLVVALGRHYYAIVTLATPLLYQFMCILLRLEARRTAFIRFNWIMGILFSIAAVGTPWMVSGVWQYPWGMVPGQGVLGAGMILWIFASAVLGSLDLHHAYRSALPFSIERRRLGLFAVAVVSLCLGTVDFLNAAGVAMVPVGFLGVLTFVVLTAYITRRYGLVEVTAQLAADEIAAMIRGALLILDRDGVIQVVNARTMHTLGLTRHSLLGMPARRLLGDAFSVRNLSRIAQLEWHDIEKEFIYSDPLSGKTRDLAFSASAVRDNHGREVAYVCILRDVTEQKRVHQRRLSEGLRDTLTGLHNRTMFLGLVDASVKQTRESPDHAYAVCFLGLDRLRFINEDLGYAVGDQVLVEIAGRLRQMVRPQDAVARIGGDEFGILIDGGAELDYVQGFVHRMEAAIRSPLSLGDHNLYCAVSIGVATGELDYASGADVLRNAGIAMHRAKQGGRGGAHFVTAGGMGLQRTRLESDLRRAVEKQEFVVHYQPVVNLEERRVVGFEALVRWQHPERGLLEPAEFIEFAEQVGLIGTIDRHVFQRACADLREFQQTLDNRQFSVSVNLADVELLDSGLVERVRQSLDQYDLEPSSVRIELLERMAHVEPVRDTLRRLRDLGVGLYIDDFGTGHSSLSRLQDVPVTAVKIDRYFVRAMTLGEGGEKIISSIVVLARNLGLDIIAEGAAVADQVMRLREIGCREVQGYYFSKPLPFDAALELLRNPHWLSEKLSILEGRRLGPVPVPARFAALLSG